MKNSVDREVERYLNGKLNELEDHIEADVITFYGSFFAPGGI